MPRSLKRFLSLAVTVLGLVLICWAISDPVLRALRVEGAGAPSITDEIPAVSLSASEESLLGNAEELHGPEKSLVIEVDPKRVIEVAPDNPLQERGAMGRGIQGSIRPRVQPFWPPRCLHADYLVVATPVDGAHSPYSDQVKWVEDGGRWYGEFGFAELSSQSYRIQPETLGGFSWTPHSLVVEPGESVEFMLDNSGSLTGLVLYMHDEQTREIIDRLRVTVSIGDSGGFSFGVDSGHFTPVAFRVDRGMRMIVSRNGFVPVLLSEKDIALGAAGRWLIRRPMMRGWGTVFIVLGPHGNPVDGAKVVLDGGMTGFTNSMGLFLASSASKPEWYSISRDGWESEDGDIYHHFEVEEGDLQLVVMRELR